METATVEEIAELLGDRADESVSERLADIGVTLDEVAEALDDLEHEVRFGETRVAATPRIEEIRTVLEELPLDEPEVDEEEEQEAEGLTVTEVEGEEPEELGPEP